MDRRSVLLSRWRPAAVLAGACALTACGPGPLSFGADGSPDAATLDGEIGAEVGAADARARDVSIIDARVDGSSLRDASDVLDATNVRDAAEAGADARDGGGDGAGDAGVCAGRLRGTVTLPVASVSGTIDGPMSYDWLCGGSNYSVAYNVHVDAPTGLYLQVNDASADYFVGLRDSCTGEGNECATASSTGAVCAELEAGDAFLLVEAQWSRARYDFTAQTFALPSNIDCADADDLPPGTTLSDVSLVGPSALAAACRTAAVHHAYYRTQIPPNQHATLTVTPLDPTRSSPVPDVRSGCGGAPVGAAIYGPRIPAVWQYDNAGDVPQDVVIDLNVGSSSSAVSPHVRVDLAVRPLPPNDYCGGALPVADGTTLMDVDLGGAPAAAPELYYAVTIPADATLVATAVSNLDVYPPQVDLLADCTASAELVSVDGILTSRNRSGSPRSVVLKVTNPYGASPFDIGFRILPPAANGACANAQPVTDGSHFPQAVTSAGDWAATLPCSSPQAPVLYYSATVPPGYVLAGFRGQAGPSGRSASFSLLSTCAAGTCLMPPGGEELAYVNSGAAPLPVVVAVGPTWGGDGATPDVNFTLHPNNTNTSCATATVVTDRMHVRGANAGDVRINGCVFGQALVYRATVQPGERLAVVPHRVSRFVLLHACSPTDCGTNYDSLNLFRYVNTGAAPEDVWFVAYPNGPLVDFDVALGPPDYVETSVPTQCDDMTGATAFDIESAGTNGLSLPQPVPFPFALDGDPVANFSITRGGSVLLSPTRQMALGLGAFEAAIPDPAGDNGFLAPFGTYQLDPIAGGGSDVRFAVFGAAPSRHLTVQWTNQTLRGESGSLLTFQAKLFESSNAVEFHYCSLVPGTSSTGTASTGSQSSVGIESLNGYRGYSHSFHTAGAVSTAAAIRLTPTN